MTATTRRLSLLSPALLLLLLLLLPSVLSADLVRVSVATNGDQGLGEHTNVSISGDGRFVVFDTGSLFDPNDVAWTDIYLRDRDLDEDGIFDEPGAVATLPMSVSIDEEFADYNCYAPSISDNGRFVSFYSRATNLTDEFTSGSYSQLYLRDRDQSGNRIFYEVDEEGDPIDIAVLLASPSYSNPTRAADRSSLDNSAANNGRVAFSSTSTNLVSVDANGSTQDVFLYDPDADGDWYFDPAAVLTRVSEAAPPPWIGRPWGTSGWPSISRDGRFVAYESDAEDLVEPSYCEDVNTDVCVKDIFVLDRDHNGNGVSYEVGDLVTVQISRSPSGEAADGESSYPDLSPDGRFVVFTSDASNLVAGNPTGNHCYVYDRDFDGDGIFDEAGGTSTVLVSVSTGGELANSHCSYPSISSNGRFVVFNSLADNLVVGDTNGYRDTFVHDRDAGRDGVFDEPGDIETVRISVSPSGAQTTGHSEGRTDISADGRYIAFESDARLLLPEDTNHVNDIYVADNPFSHDPDGDGVEQVEESGPGGDEPDYDGNGDELADSEQDNVASLHNNEGDAYVTVAVVPVAVPPLVSLKGVEAPEIPAPEAMPGNVEIPYGVFGFTIEGVERGGAVTVELHLPEGEELNSYWKYGRTHERSDLHWYEFVKEPGDIVGAEIVGSVVYLDYVDGENGDGDLAANGVIVDPGAPVFIPEPSAALLACAALTTLGALACRRRTVKV